MKNKRGLFLTNIISKLFEKILEEVIGEIHYNEHQHGGRKGRGVIDNWLIMMAIRDSNQKLKKNTYIFFADLVKCFDRLWLKDYIVDMRIAGVRERELRMLFKMNEKANIMIKTPAGITEEIKVKEIVKQGTVFGPRLCCASTGRVNDMGDPGRTIIYPNIEVGALAFVDDISG